MRHDKEVDKAIEERFGKLGRPLHDERKADKWYDSHKVIYSADGLPLESPRANPDMVSDEEVRHLLPESQHTKDRQTDITNERWSAIKNCPLTKQQRSILELVSQGLTHQEIGKMLHMKTSRVQASFWRARKHIEKFYEKTRMISENQSSSVGEEM